MVLYSVVIALQSVLLIWGGVFLFCAKMPRRKYFPITIIFGIALNISISFVWMFYLNNISYAKELIACCGYLILYIWPFLIVFASFDCKVFTALFCATMGYCMQHLVSRLIGLMTILIGLPNTAWLQILLMAVFTAIVYPSVLLPFRQRSGKVNRDITFNNPIQLLVAAFAVCVMIVVEYSMIPYLFNINNKGVVCGNYVSSCIFVIMVLLLELNLISRADYKNELETIKQISQIEHEQYAVEKTVIDTINVKCHDLKHQLASLNGKIDNGEFNKIMTAIDVYDSTFKTGNNALDVVLTMKSMVCKHKNIELTCLIDGEKLSFMSDPDIYSLFGNILDNAIEACEKIEEIDRRIISITMRQKDSLLFITVDNNYAEDPIIVDGVIQSGKSDKHNHGYGLTSIKMIVKSYNGECKIEARNGVFTVNIMFLQ